MIYFDVTKASRQGHRSGLTRVSERLRAELGADVTPVTWGDCPTAAVRPDDWWFTAELFCEAERPGFWQFLRNKPCRVAAMFSDAIPLQHPHITWPHSVARHPEYMKMLASCDRVWAISATCRETLLGYWRWLEVVNLPPVEVLALGADLAGQKRLPPTTPSRPPVLLCVGILEPRKNQTFLLDVCADLWRAGVEFELHLVGRVNPHFGAPVVAKIKALQREFSGLHYHAAADDATVAGLFGRARATVFPTLAEGCGLPLLESLWMGVPCVCSDLPVLRENADGGGCVPVTLNDRAAWGAALRRVIGDDTWHAQLAAAAGARPLPTWSAAAAALRAGLR
ncbi:MAG: glycosyltransferase [Opitutae bacterium]|nr:glycosyltransferase [Opitutae bacterium]